MARDYPVQYSPERVWKLVAANVRRRRSLRFWRAIRLLTSAATGLRQFSNTLSETERISSSGALFLAWPLLQRLCAMTETFSQTEPVAHARFDQCHLLGCESAQKALRLNRGNRNRILDQKGPWF